MRLDYVPVEADGSRGDTDTYQLTGDQCSVVGEILRFRPALRPLGLGTVARVTGVAGHAGKTEHDPAAPGGPQPTDGKDPKTKPNAFVRDKSTLPAWLALYRDGRLGPLGVLLEDAHGQAVLQPPEKVAPGTAATELWVSPSGYVVEPAAS
jgi:hypothetical protein